jgi:hypothetical protein
MAVVTTAKSNSERFCRCPKTRWLAVRCGPEFDGKSCLDLSSSAPSEISDSFSRAILGRMPVNFDSLGQSAKTPASHWHE